MERQTVVDRAMVVGVGHCSRGFLGKGFLGIRCSSLEIGFNS